MAREEKRPQNTELHRLAAQLCKKKLQKETRAELHAQLFDKTKGTFCQLLKKQADQRLVQVCLRHGTDKHRLQILDEIKEEIVALSFDLTGKHVVFQLIRSSVQIQEKVLEILSPHLAKIAKTKQGCLVVNELYLQTKPLARRAILQNHLSPQEIEDVAERLVGVQRIETEASMLIVCLYVSSCKSTVVDLLVNEMQEYVREHICSIVETKEGVEMLCALLVHATAAGQQKICSLLLPSIVGLLCSPNSLVVGTVASLVAVKHGDAEFVATIRKNISGLMENDCGELFAKYILTGRMVLLVDHEKYVRGLESAGLRETLKLELRSAFVSVFAEECARLPESLVCRQLPNIDAAFECAAETTFPFWKDIKMLSQKSVRLFLARMMKHAKNEDIATKIVETAEKEAAAFCRNDSIYLLASVWNEFPEHRRQIETLVQSEAETGEGMQLLRRKIEAQL